MLLTTLLKFHSPVWPVKKASGPQRQTDYHRLNMDVPAWDPDIITITSWWQSIWKTCTLFLLWLMTFTWFLCRMRIRTKLHSYKTVCNMPLLNGFDEKYMAIVLYLVTDRMISANLNIKLDKVLSLAKQVQLLGDT